MKDRQTKWLQRAFWVTWFILFLVAGLVVWALVRDHSTTQVNNYISKTPGKSAYQMAVEHGFKGNEVMWLASLKATSIKGDDGKDSVSHETVEKTTVKQTIVKEKSVPGPAGAKGEKGDTPQFAQDSITGQMYTKLPQDDDWKAIPKLCLGILCGGGQ